MYIHCKTRVNQCHTNSVEKNIFCVHITGDSHQCASFVDLSCKTNICPLRNDWLDEKSRSQWCRTKSRSKKTYHWRYILRSNRLCGTIQKQLTKKYGTGIFWHPGKIWHFWSFLAFFGVFGCHFHSAVLFPRVFGTAYDIYPPQTSA